MTRLLYLPDDVTVIQLEVDFPAGPLCASVNAGMRPLPVLRSAPAGKLVASLLGHTVIVAVLEKKPVERQAPFSATALSHRQSQVYELASRGMNSGEIAIMLHLSRRTVNHHLNQVKNRLRLEGRTPALPLPLPLEFSKTEK